MKKLLSTLTILCILCLTIFATACEPPIEKYSPDVPPNLAEGKEEWVVRPATNAPYVRHIHYVKSPNGYIYGEMILPSDFDENKEYPIIIMSHGFTATFDTEFSAYFYNLVPKGYVCYVFDFCGGSEKSKSDGKFADMTVMTEVEDLKAVISDIKKQDYVKRSKLILMGASMGGLVTALTEEQVDGIDATVMLFPAFNLSEDINASYSSAADIPDNPQFIGIDVSKEFVSCLIGVDIYDVLGRHEGDVVIYHGDTDNIVPLQTSRYAALAYPNADLVVIEGGSHGLQRGSHTTFVCNNLVEWLEERGIYGIK